jgi:hypothetical protein
MSLSMQDYVIRLRAMYQQVEALSNPDGHVPTVSVQEWTEVLNYAFEVVPELETHWREIGEWVAHMTTLLDAYHVLAGQLLEEEETAKIPTSPLPQGRRGLLDYQAADRD